jgi:hypothetical protein
MTFTDALRGSLQVDGSKWNDFPFVEKKALHFEPQTPELSNQ